MKFEINQIEANEARNAVSKLDCNLTIFSSSMWLQQARSTNQIKNNHETPGYVTFEWK